MCVCVFICVSVRLVECDIKDLLYSFLSLFFRSLPFFIYEIREINTHKRERKQFAFVILIQKERDMERMFRWKFPKWARKRRSEERKKIIHDLMYFSKYFTLHIYIERDPSIHTLCTSRRVWVSYRRLCRNYIESIFESEWNKMGAATKRKESELRYAIRREWGRERERGWGKWERMGTKHSLSHCYVSLISIYIKWTN